MLVVQMWRNLLSLQGHKKLILLQRGEGPSPLTQRGFPHDVHAWNIILKYIGANLHDSQEGVRLCAFICLNKCCTKFTVQAIINFGVYVRLYRILKQ